MSFSGDVISDLRLTLIFDEYTRTVEQLHCSIDDLVHHRLQRFIGWCWPFDEDRRAVGAALVHAVQHQAVQSAEFDAMIGAAVEALKAWVLYRESGGTAGASSESNRGWLGSYPRD